jgi:hypothetical protein
MLIPNMTPENFQLMKDAIATERGPVLVEHLVEYLYAGFIDSAQTHKTLWVALAHHAELELKRRLEGK